MVAQKIAEKFAQEWVEAWNSHDIEKIISHYTDSVVLISPIAEKLLGNPEVRGKEAVKSYFEKGLQVYPDLCFTIERVLCGQESIVLCYINQNGTHAGEFMHLNSDLKVVRMFAHYNGQG